MPKHAHNDADKIVADRRRISCGIETERGSKTDVTVGSVGSPQVLAGDMPEAEDVTLSALASVVSVLLLILPRF